MKPVITLLVRTRNGAAAAIAEAGRRRAADLGLRVDIVHVGPDADAPMPPLIGAPVGDDENVTAVVPVEFSAAQHEAWCFLCQLSLLRQEVGFAILVLGATSSAEFQARQRALIDRSAGSSAGRRPRAGSHPKTPRKTRVA